MIFMKAVFLSLAIATILACNSSNETGDRQYDMKTDTSGGNTGIVTDSTKTSNNNAYNTDSASGQGTTYDTSSNNKK